MSDYKILGEGLNFSEVEVSDKYAYVTASDGGGIDADLDAICDYYYGMSAFVVDFFSRSGTATVPINFPDPLERVNNAPSRGGSGNIGSEAFYNASAGMTPIRLLYNGATVGYNLSGVFDSQIRFSHPSGGTAFLNLTPFVYDFQAQNLSANNQVFKVKVGRGLNQYARVAGNAGFTEASMEARIGTNQWGNVVRTKPSGETYWYIFAGAFTYTN